MGARRVLVADDDAIARRLLCILLDLHEYGLLEAHDTGTDAYLARPYSPLALLDVVQRLSRG